MQREMIYVLSQVLPYVVIVLGLTACLLLFVSLKREFESRWLRYAHTFEELSARLKAAEEQVTPQAVPAIAPLPPPGFNWNQRVRAQRLSRQGKGASEIAGVLGAPAKEIELLLRIQQLTADVAIADQA